MSSVNKMYEPYGSWEEAFNAMVAFIGEKTPSYVSISRCYKGDYILTVIL